MLILWSMSLPPVVQNKSFVYFGNVVGIGGGVINTDGNNYLKTQNTVVILQIHIYMYTFICIVLLYILLLLLYGRAYSSIVYKCSFGSSQIGRFATSFQIINISPIASNRYSHENFTHHMLHTIVHKTHVCFFFNPNID